ncbi:hypothetical protein DL93DRAFT_743207 [Clavulina sp. PMI_390]|nr:hypothetical protein DL93DRAFT_743207 [Clavulina sp. PMI_390]
MKTSTTSEWIRYSSNYKPTGPSYLIYSFPRWSAAWPCNLDRLHDTMSSTFQNDQMHEENLDTPPNEGGTDPLSHALNAIPSLSLHTLPTQVSVPPFSSTQAPADRDLEAGVNLPPSQPIGSPSEALQTPEYPPAALLPLPQASNRRSGTRLGAFGRSISSKIRSMTDEAFCHWVTSGLDSVRNAAVLDVTWWW